MIRFITVLFITALLGGCVVVPADYAYPGDGYGHRYYRHYHYYGDDGPYWRHRR